MIESNINEVELKQDSAAKALIDILLQIDREIELGEASIYHNFPIYKDALENNPIIVNVLFVCTKYGVIYFDCIDSSDRIDIDKTLDSLNNIDRIIFSKLIRFSKLQETRRELKFKIKPVLFISTEPDLKYNEEFVTIAYSKNLVMQSITQNNGRPLQASEFKMLKSILEGSIFIKQIHERNLSSTRENTKGKILSRIENEIAIFDREQKNAALHTLEGPQRIRGLAGSGKTIILTYKAALIHLQNPDATILYTYYTKPLMGTVKRLITKFYRQNSDIEPNWDKIKIMHAWGGANLSGVYYTTCVSNDILPKKLEEAKIASFSDPFNKICEELVNTNLKQVYDYTLIDEAQDIPKYFYRLCRKITKNNQIVWAYDDFQNIFDIIIQDEKDTFGKDVNGIAYVDFSKYENELHDLVLHVCYRNPKSNLIAAFALGLGIYNDNGNRVLQRLENNEHWKDLGFTVESGGSQTGDTMIISRSKENSPINVNETGHENSIQIFEFDNLEDECQEISKLITKDIKEEELLPDDILVICMDKKNVKKYFNKIEDNLESNGINVFNLLDAPYNNTIFRVKDHTTLSTINIAKGNECGCVYIVGIDAIFFNKNSIIERNKLFTAMTRSQGWLTLSGIKPLASICINEFDLLKKNDYKLIFKQPSSEDTKTIMRNFSVQQQKLNKIEKDIEKLSKQLGISKEEIVKMITGTKKMNEGKFKDSINDGIKFLKIFGNFKMKGIKPIGEVSGDFKDASYSSDYHNMYNVALRNLDYDILLDDESFFQFSNHPSSNTNYPFLRFAFFQNPIEWKSYEDFLVDNEIDFSEAEEELTDYYYHFLDNNKINTKCISLRYDLNIDQYTPNIHSISHIHLGNVQDVRVPLDKVMTPLQFIIFVMKIVYHRVWEAKILAKDTAFLNYVFKTKVQCKNLNGGVWNNDEKKEMFIT